MAKWNSEKVTTKSGLEIEIRSLNAKDAAAFKDYMVKMSTESTHTTQYPGKVYSAVEAYEKQLSTVEAANFDLFLGAIKDGTLIGLANIVKPFGGDHPWVPHLAHFGMSTLKDFWGQGIGRVTLSKLLDHAQSHHIKKVEASVRANNPRAIQLYKNMGFEIEGTRRMAVLINGEYIDEYHIAKFFTV